MASAIFKRILTRGLLLSALMILLTGFGTAQSSARAATNEYRRLVNLRTALGKIPFIRVGATAKRPSNG